MGITLNAAPPPPPEPGSVPRKTPVNPAKEPRKAKSDISLASEKEIERWFLKMYGMVGSFLSVVKPEIGNRILLDAEKCAAANAALAMENESIRRTVSAAMVTGVYGAVIAAHLPLILVILAEFVTNDPEKRINSNMLLGFASLIGDDPDEVIEDVSANAA
jgi:hypothetical protein